MQRLIRLLMLVGLTAVCHQLLSRCVLGAVARLVRIKGTVILSTVSRFGILSLAMLLPLFGLVQLSEALVGVKPVSALPAATFTVSSLNDSGAGSLRQAILDANATAGANVIEITAVGPLTLLSPLPIINEALTIQGPGTVQLLIDGGQAFRVFESTAVPLTITDLTIQNGNPASGEGGGIRSLGALSLSNVDVLSNTAPVGGGGVYAAGEVQMVNGRFENNRALGSLGGGLWADSQALITGTRFISNTAPGQGGGAVVQTLSTLVDARFERNHSLAANGGGLYASGIVTLSHTTLISNTAFSDGGGMLAFGQANLYQTQFIGNECSDQGGAAYVGSFLTVQQSAFVGNQGGRGGAVFHGGLTGVWENSLFARNTATTAGDHLFLNNSFNAVLNHITAVGRASGSGTGFHMVNSDVTLSNTIIASHTLGLNNLNGSISQDYNLFFGNGSDTQGAVSGGSSNVSGDPRFLDPANDNYHLGAGSAALDVGSSTGLLVDYDGEIRPLDGGFDIGFDEANFAVSPPPTIFLPLVLR